MTEYIKGPEIGSVFSLLFDEGFVSLRVLDRQDFVYEYNPVLETNISSLQVLPPIQQKVQQVSIGGQTVNIVVDIPVFIGPYTLSAIRAEQSPNTDFFSIPSNLDSSNIMIFYRGLYPTGVWMYDYYERDNTAVAALPLFAPTISDFNFGALKGSDSPYEDIQRIRPIVAIKGFSWRFSLLNTYPFATPWRMKTYIQWLRVEGTNNPNDVAEAIRNNEVYRMGGIANPAGAPDQFITDLDLKFYQITSQAPSIPSVSPVTVPTSQPVMARPLQPQGLLQRITGR